MKKHQFDIHKSQAQQKSAVSPISTDFVYVFNEDALDDVIIKKKAVRDAQAKKLLKQERKENRAKKYGYGS